GRIGVGTNNPAFDLTVNIGSNLSGAMELTGSPTNVPLYIQNTGSGGQLWGITSASNGSLNGSGTLTLSTFGNSPLLTLLSPNTTKTSGGAIVINMPNSTQANR